MRTVSLSITPARQATRSALDRALSSHSRCSAGRALPSNRKALGARLGPAPATIRVAAPTLKDQFNQATRTPQEAKRLPGEIATPQGIFPAGIFFKTCIFTASTTVTSLDGPFAV